MSCVLPKVAGGTDIIRQSLGAFKPPTVATTMVIDLVTYDSWPALATMEEHL